MTDTDFYSVEQVFVKIFDDFDDEDDLRELDSDSDNNDQLSASTSNDVSALLRSQQPSTSPVSSTVIVPNANQPSTSDFSDPNALLDANYFFMPCCTIFSIS